MTAPPSPPAAVAVGDAAGGWDPDAAVGRALDAAREIIDALLPGLRLGDVLRSILDAVAADEAAHSPCRDEARFTLVASALAAGEIRPDAVRLAAAVVLLEVGLHLLEQADAGGRWISPLGYSAKVLSLSGCSLLGYLPAALVHALPDPAGPRDRVLSDLFRVLARISAERLEQVELGRTVQAALVGNEPIVRLGIRVRRPSYAIMAARLAGVPDASTEIHAALGRSLGIAHGLRRDLVDLFDDARGHAFATGEVTAPLAIYLAQAEARDQSEMRRLHGEGRTSRAARSSVRHRLQKSGVLRQVVATIQDHCARAQEQADRLRPAPAIERIVRNEIGCVSLV